MSDLGPNHKAECTGTLWTYSGEGYDRVRLCACGAEDFAPAPGSLDAILAKARVSAAVAQAKGE